MNIGGPQSTYNTTDTILSYTMPFIKNKTRLSKLIDFIQSHSIEIISSMIVIFGLIGFYCALN